MRILAALAVALAIPASASAATVHVDANGGADGPACGPQASPCATIQQGIANAAAGDTVAVAGGTYAGQVIVDKAISLEGAGAGTTVIDGGEATDFNRNGTLRLSSSEGPVRVAGLTVTGVGVPAAEGTPVGIVVEPDDITATPEFTLDGVEVVGRGAGGEDYGLWCENNRADVVIADSVFTGSDFNPLLFENCTGALDVSGSRLEKTPGTTPSSALFSMAYQGREVTRPQRVRDNAVSGGAISFNGAFVPEGAGTYADVEITGNTVEGGGIALSNLADADSDGTIDAPVVSGNTLTGSGGGDGIRLDGDVPGARIEGNTVRGYGNGLHLRAAASGEPAGAVALANRIAGNGTGARNAGGAELAAEDNWWGCNAGPGAAGCDPLVGAVDAGPWLVLRAAATKTEVALDEPSTITVDLLENSDGETAAGAFPAGTEVAFAANIGTLTPAAGTLDDRVTETTFSSSRAGKAVVRATLDGQTLEVPIRVLSPCKLLKLNISLLRPFGVPDIPVCL